MGNKLQELTQKLYNEGLSKGRQEADTLLDNAKDEAAKIIADAKVEAKRIADDAQRDADDLRKNTMTEVSLAGRQAVTKLKEAIAEMIIAKSVSGDVAKANLDPQFVKDILVAVAKNWQGSSTDRVELKAMLPADKEQALGSAFEQSVKGAMSEGLDIAYSSEVKSGFRIEPKNGGYYISFSDADFDALLGEFLRPKVSHILYGDDK